MVDGREQNVYLAKLAEQAERYDEMAEHMKVCATKILLVRTGLAQTSRPSNLIYDEIAFY